MTDIEKQKNIEGWIFFVLFCADHSAANWMIGHVGTVCVANGPCLIPVAPRPHGAVRRADDRHCAGAARSGAAPAWRRVRHRRHRRRRGDFGRACAALAGARLGRCLSAVGICRFRRLYAARPPPPGAGGARLEPGRACCRLHRVPVARLRLARFPRRPDGRQVLDGAARHPVRRLSCAAATSGSASTPLSAKVAYVRRSKP